MKTTRPPRKKKTVSWPESDWLKSKQYCINQHLQRLDRIITHYDAVYGHGKILMVADADMQEKISRQWRKLEEAIEKEEVANVAALVEGFSRGYAAMAENVPPIDHKQWEGERDGRRYVFVQTHEAAMGMDTDTEVITLEQIIDIWNSRKADLYKC